MVDRKIIVFSLNADDGGQSPRGRFRIFHYEFRCPFFLFVRSAVYTSNVVAYAASGACSFTKKRARRAATCAQELISVMDVCLARACSQNGRLGRQLSLVLSGIAKGRGAGFFVSGDAIRQHDGRLTATRAA